MQVGFKCIKDHEKVSANECELCSMTGDCMPFSYVNILVQGMKRPHYFPSVTALTSWIHYCPRKMVLEHNLNYYINPYSMAWAYRGTGVHKANEAVEYVGAIKEQLVELKVGKYVLKGTPDLVLPDQGILIDYKTRKSCPCDENHINVGQLIKPNYALQLNIYALALAPKIKIEKMFLEYFFFEGEIPCYSVPVDIDLVNTQKVINKYLPEMMEKVKGGILPDYQECSKKFKWMCDGYCDVVEECKAFKNSHNLIDTIPGKPVDLKGGGKYA